MAGHVGNEGEINNYSKLGSGPTALTIITVTSLLRLLIHIRSIYLSVG